MFEIKLGTQGEIVLRGRLDASEADRAQEFLDGVREPSVVDFAALDYISSAGLGVLLRAQKRLMGSGGSLKLINVNHHIQDIFRYAGFDRIFEISGAGADT